jgi:hypothetical protein
MVQAENKVKCENRVSLLRTFSLSLMSFLERHIRPYLLYCSWLPNGNEYIINPSYIDFILCTLVTSQTSSHLLHPLRDSSAKHQTTPGAACTHKALRKSHLHCVPQILGEQVQSHTEGRFQGVQRPVSVPSCTRSLLHSSQTTPIPRTTGGFSCLVSSKAYLLRWFSLRTSKHSTLPGGLWMYKLHQYLGVISASRLCLHYEPS